MHYYTLRRMSQPDMESIFTKIIFETIMWIIKIKCFYPPRILDEQWCIYSCWQIPPRENWFQYVREYTQPQLTFLALHPCIYVSINGKLSFLVVYLSMGNIHSSILFIYLSMENIQSFIYLSSQSCASNVAEILPSPCV